MTDSGNSSAHHSSAHRFCIHCGAALPAAAKFCSQCGTQVASAARGISLTGSALVKIGVVSAAAFAAAWGMQSSLGGTPPTKKFEQTASHAASSTTGVEDSQLRELRASAEAEPKEVSRWVTLAQALAERLRGSDQPNPELVFETIDALRKILDLDAENPFALIAMADVSFEQQAFSKAAEFYKRYLEKNGDDLNARARYASTLAFLNQHSQALHELETVLKRDPENFNAKAYMAITYAQLGEHARAKEVGEAAVKLAPTDEARARFSEFLEKLTTPPPERGTIEKGDDKNGSEGLSDHAQKIVEKVQENPVAGPKFAGAVMQDSSTLALRFSQFPMSEMPPFIKERFLGSFRSLSIDPSKQSVGTLIFVDQESGEVMERLTLGAPK